MREAGPHPCPSVHATTPSMIIVCPESSTNVRTLRGERERGEQRAGLTFRAHVLTGKTRRTATPPQWPQQQEESVQAQAGPAAYVAPRGAAATGTRMPLEQAERRARGLARGDDTSAIRRGHRMPDAAVHADTPHALRNTAAAGRDAREAQGGACQWEGRGGGLGKGVGAGEGRRAPRAPGPPLRASGGRETPSGGPRRRPKHRPAVEAAARGARG